MEYFLGALSVLIGWIIGFFLSYMKEKGKNVATKEDITVITRLTESAKYDFQKQLEDHKRSFDFEIEGLKHKQNKLYTSYELFTVKRHESYPELYKLLEICNGAVRRLRGIRRTLHFNNVNTQDIKAFMEDKSFTSSDIDYILSLWETQNKKAITEINYRLERINYNEAEEKFIEANDYYFFNVLFLSEEVEKMARDLLNNIHTIWLNYDPNYSMYGTITGGIPLSKNEELIKQIDQLRSDLKLKMRQELLPN
ncbi:hypothetical protein ACQKL5_17285 [Peribacillus sp. NPDC097675]|uniref:hypothetical protein n=1 Tax=Peribacillus sp. NPDC097675 TaxID=3390618 RepID=UPI003D040876